MIRYEESTKFFQLDTKNTSYCMAVLDTGHVEHMYYGSKIKADAPDFMLEKRCLTPGNCNAYDSEHPITLEDACLEMSGYGKGDIREPFIEAVFEDGSTTTDFVFDYCLVDKGKKAYKTLPGSYDDDNKQDHLMISMKDKNSGCTLELHYYVYEEEDVITRSAKFVNTSDNDVKLTRLMSAQLDVDEAGFVITSFHGGWTQEMNKHDVTLSAGRFVNSSFTGGSSSRSNPFVMMSRPETTEYMGDCFGFNLIYSGNHYESFEVNSFDKTRFVSGINPANFEFLIEPKGVFEAPEAVMTFSKCGHNGMSQNMHAFVRKHIVRGKWRDKVRPILLNSWEAAYFDINESKLLNLAAEGKKLGMELFVMDDGWFGKRDGDTAALGDWKENTDKLPHGVQGLAERVNDLGMDFGIWVEPEMVNVDSDLYRAHPDWAICIPDKDHSEGRNQRILDLSNPEVVEYMTKAMSDVFSLGNIAYVKWDMNRTFTDYFSQYLPKDKQGEVAHRYMMGLYKMMKDLTEKFPEILFEGCASGGNRFDLGILSYFPQIWASDCTDAVERLKIQNGYSYGYPMSTVSAHVSGCPNHQTLRTTPIDTRFNVASFGVLGYECNLADATKEEKEAIKEQIEIYKKYRETMQFGAFYRQSAGNVYEWTVVSPDKSTAIGMVTQILMQAGKGYQKFTANGLDPDKKYHFFGRELKYHLKEYGDLVNTGMPSLPLFGKPHINPNNDTMMNLLNKMNPMNGEKEDCEVYGDALMNCGVKLKQAYTGVGYNGEGETRHFPDFGSRIYFIEEV